MRPLFRGPGREERQVEGGGGQAEVLCARQEAGQVLETAVRPGVPEDVRQVREDVVRLLPLDPRLHLVAGRHEFPTYDHS